MSLAMSNAVVINIPKTLACASCKTLAAASRWYCRTCLTNKRKHGKREKSSIKFDLGYGICVLDCFRLVSLTFSSDSQDRYPASQSCSNSLDTLLLFVTVLLLAHASVFASPIWSSSWSRPDSVIESVSCESDFRLTLTKNIAMYGDSALTCINSAWSCKMIEQSDGQWVHQNAKFWGDAMHIHTHCTCSWAEKWEREMNYLHASWLKG